MSKSKTKEYTVSFIVSSVHSFTVRAKDEESATELATELADTEGFDDSNLEESCISHEIYSVDEN